MKQRCLNPRCRAYHNYGARGITVCQDWYEFEPFCKWALSSGYEKGLDLDRIDNDGNYEPANCRWVDRKTNTNNRRMTIYLTIDGETKPRAIWEEMAGIPPGVTLSWLKFHGKEYAEERIRDAIHNGYTQKDFGYSHREPVVHLETGLTFRSMKEAAAYFGISPCRISLSITQKGSTGKGTFRKLGVEG